MPTTYNCKFHGIACEYPGYCIRILSYPDKLEKAAKVIRNFRDMWKLYRGPKEDLQWYDDLADDCEQIAQYLKEENEKRYDV